MPMCVPSVFKYEQQTPSDTWIINHNLGSNGGQGIPVIDVAAVISGNTVKVIPSRVEILSRNSVRLTFTTPRTGTATVIV